MCDCRYREAEYILGDGTKLLYCPQCGARWSRKEVMVDGADAVITMDTPLDNAEPKSYYGFSKYHD